MSSQGSHGSQEPGRSGIYGGGDSEEQEGDESFWGDDSREKVKDKSFRGDNFEETGKSGLHEGGVSEATVNREQFGNSNPEEPVSSSNESRIDNSEKHLNAELFEVDESEETRKRGLHEDGISEATENWRSPESSDSEEPMSSSELAGTSDETEDELAANTSTDDVKFSPMRIVKIDTEPFVKGKTIDEMSHLSVSEDIIRIILGQKPTEAAEQQVETSETKSRPAVTESISSESNCSSSIIGKLVYQELQFKPEIHKRLLDEKVNFKLKLFVVKRPEMSAATKLFKNVLTDKSWEELQSEKEMAKSYLLFFYRNIETKSDKGTEKVITPEIFSLGTGLAARPVLRHADENFSKSVERRTLEFPFHHVEYTKDSGPIIKETKSARPGHEILFSVWEFLDNIVGNRTRKLREYSSLYSTDLNKAFLSKTGRKLPTKINVTEKGIKIRRSFTIPQLGLILKHFSKICLNEQTFLINEPWNKVEEVDDPSFGMHDFYCKIEDRNLWADLDNALQNVLQSSMEGQPSNLYLVHRDYEKWMKSENISLYAKKSRIGSTEASKRTRRTNIKTWNQPPSLDEVVECLQNYCGKDSRNEWLNDAQIKFSGKTGPLKEFIFTRISLRQIGTYVYRFGSWLQMSAHYLYLIEKNFAEIMTDHFLEAKKLHLLPWKNISKEETKRKNDKRTTKKDTKENNIVATTSTEEEKDKDSDAASPTREQKAKTIVFAKTNVATSSTKKLNEKKEVVSNYRFTNEKFDKEKESEKWKDHFKSLNIRSTFKNVKAEIDELVSAECLKISSELGKTPTAKVAAHLYLLHECTLKEYDYNASHALLNKLLTDKGTKMIACDNMTPHGIELCDILIWDENTTYFVHVKAGYKGDPIRDVCSQIRNAADHIYRELTISKGTGIIKEYWNILTSHTQGFHKEEAKRVLEEMGEDKFYGLFHSKRDIVFVLACRDVRKREDFGHEAKLPRDLEISVTEEIKGHFIQTGDDVLNKLKNEGYLTKNGSLTDKFIRDGKMSKTKFQNEIKGWPEIGSLKAAEELFKILTKNLSKSKATVAKMEIIRLVTDFKRYNVGHKQFQLRVCSIDHQFSL